MVQLLLSKGADPDTADEDGYNLPHIAAEMGHFEMVKTLVRHGADVSVCGGWTPLALAAWFGHIDIVDLLIPSYPHWQDIILACRGHTTILQHLHEQYNLDLQQKDVHNRSLLHLAAGHGHVETLRFLVDRSPDILAKDAKGDDILCYAASSGSLETLEAARGMIPTPSTPRDGNWSLLHWACRVGNKEVVERLIQAGIESTSVAISQPAGTWNPIDIAMLHGHSEMLHELSDQCRIALGPLTTLGKKSGRLISVDRFHGSTRCAGEISYDGCSLVSRVFMLSFLC